MQYPINTELKFHNLKHGIQTIKEYNKDLEANFDFYIIKNPIYNNNHIQIFCKSEIQNSTKIIAEHFYNINDLLLLHNADYKRLKSNVIWKIIITIIIIVVISVILGITFNFLEIKSLSMIPLLSLIILTITLLFLIIYSIKLNIISKVINNEFQLEKRFLALYIYKLKRMEESEEKSGLIYEIDQMIEEFKK